MRVFKTRWFVRFARKERIADRALRDAVDRADRGSVDADLGAGLIKQRMARSGQGKSGGYRKYCLSDEQAGDLRLWICQERQSNLEPDELEGYRELATLYLARSEKAWSGMAEGALVKVTDEEEDKSD